MGSLTSRVSKKNKKKKRNRSNVFKEVCEIHQQRGTSSDDLSNFVMRVDAPDAVYLADGDKRFILLNLLAQQTERIVKLQFTCSNAYYPDYKENGVQHYLSLIFHLEDPFTGELLSCTSDTVMPVAE